MLVGTSAPMLKTIELFDYKNGKLINLAGDRYKTNAKLIDKMIDEGAYFRHEMSRVLSTLLICAAKTQDITYIKLLVKKYFLCIIFSIPSKNGYIPGASENRTTWAFDWFLEALLLPDSEKKIAEYLYEEFYDPGFFPNKLLKKIRKECEDTQRDDVIKWLDKKKL